MNVFKHICRILWRMANGKWRNVMILSKVNLPKVGFGNKAHMVMHSITWATLELGQNYR